MEEDNLNLKARYLEVDNDKQNRINDVKLIFSNIYDFIETTCKPSRETSLVMTKLEEAQFWAIKGISREVNK